MTEEFVPKIRQWLEDMTIVEQEENENFETFDEGNVTSQ